jgi:hypothetical protein
MFVPNYQCTYITIILLQAISQCWASVKPMRGSRFHKRQTYEWLTASQKKNTTPLSE